MKPFRHCARELTTKYSRDLIDFGRDEEVSAITAIRAKSIDKNRQFSLSIQVKLIFYSRIELHIEKHNKNFFLNS